MKEGEGLCYPCSKNKGADQLRGYREADLRLCFRICKNPFSHNAAHMKRVMNKPAYVKLLTTKMQISLHICFLSLLLLKKA